MATAIFETRDATSGADILTPLPINRVCLHVGALSPWGSEGLAKSLGALRVGESITFKDDCDPNQRRIWIRRLR